MNDAFWIQLPSIISAIVAGITAIIAAIAARKIDRNTKITIGKADEVSQKIESATREVKEDNKIVAKVQTATTNTQINSAAKTLNDKADAIQDSQNNLEDRINGRMDSKLALTREEAYQRGILEGAEILKNVSINTGRLDNMEKQLGRLDAFEGRLGHVETNTQEILKILHDKDEPGK